MNQPQAQQMQAYAADLEAAITPSGKQPPEGAAASIASDLWSKIQAVVTALKAGDWVGTFTAVMAFIKALTAEGPDGVIEFQAQAKAAGLDWKKMISTILVIMKGLFGA